jgi:hypothetical protein
MVPTSALHVAVQAVEAGPELSGGNDKSESCVSCITNSRETRTRPAHHFHLSCAEVRGRSIALRRVTLLSLLGNARQRGC